MKKFVIETCRILLEIGIMLFLIVDVIFAIFSLFTGNFLNLLYAFLSFTGIIFSSAVIYLLMDINDKFENKIKPTEIKNKIKIMENTEQIFKDNGDASPKHH
jgi:hypothetical protein